MAIFGGGFLFCCLRKQLFRRINPGRQLYFATPTNRYRGTCVRPRESSPSHSSFSLLSLDVNDGDPSHRRFPVAHRRASFHRSPPSPFRVAAALSSTSSGDSPESFREVPPDRRASPVLLARQNELVAPLSRLSNVDDLALSPVPPILRKGFLWD